ncbi:NAD(P)-dependent malic enzyme [Candidatus Nitrosocosmicus agrestis]|uniref:NAD(P)-dependent malic enzyme n=1 Tax=Candidatus Nitrosocosmicus agrestis TaxID=2563600 RepID=UPI00191768CE|nr:NADP-dependent malic enzyme [Candidatus Nitrosocosmicus sp. SS]MDR4491893.1 NADP-dependent malic enzyme [Candidatus Nitrosocosmicus sp.]
MTQKEDAINLHRMLRGKIEITSRVSPDNIFDDDEGNNQGTLTSIYTPGVAFVSEEIKKNIELAYEYTSKWNNVAIICDGTRVLGLGNIGPEAALPVMEGKSVLFKTLANVNAYPLCISMSDKSKIIEFVKSIQPSFGAINIEDIESPKVLEIVEQLQKELSIPVFHDDRHGTAVITLAALINALRIVKKEIQNVKVVIAGAGSAGYGIYKILHRVGIKDILVLDSRGIISSNRRDIASSLNDRSSQKNQTLLEHSTTNEFKIEIASNTNKSNVNGDIKIALSKSDVFIGTSGIADMLNEKLIHSMNENPIIFALSNPHPEIMPEVAKKSGASIVATGRSDFPNQINNAVVFPAIFRVLLDLRMKNLDEDILITVSKSIADLVDNKHLNELYIIPKINDPRILPIVTKSVKEYLTNQQPF